MYEELVIPLPIRGRRVEGAEEQPVLRIRIATLTIPTHAAFSENPSWWPFVTNAVRDAVTRCAEELEKGRP